MKRLTRDIKRVLTALGHQHAGDYLTQKQKAGIVGYAESDSMAAQPVSRVIPVPAPRRIALLTDGKGKGAPLDYVIETCSRQDAAAVDLLVHGVVDTGKLAGLEQHLAKAGVRYRTTMLDVDAVAGIADYLRKTPSLIFLVAMPHDPLARRLAEELVPARAIRIPVPLVMIEEKCGKQPVTRSA
ncbi:MAG: hypothetical protein R3179_05175 [Sedimenticolaceae bacterium]|nr:hypothetical protein [Sedimenticolaceae bacterium]